MIPNERSLVEHFQGKPVVVLGVNSDADRSAIATVSAQEGVTWRSRWDGGRANGPIAQRYHVTAWPTIYVLDGRGIIRFANVHGQALEQAVETLLREMP